MDLESLHYTMKRLHYFMTQTYSKKKSLKEYIEIFHDCLYPQYSLTKTVSGFLSFIFRGKYKIGDVISIENNIKARVPYLLITFPEYFSREFIITETPRTLGQYKMYKLYPLDYSEWESLLISQDFIDRA